jgi:hypothetical protein
LDANKQREAEIRKMVQQLNDKAAGLIQATASEVHLGMQLDQRIKTLQDLKTATETLLKETIDVLTAEGYEKNREIITYCFSSMTGIAERLDSAIRTLKIKTIK